MSPQTVTIRRSIHGGGFIRFYAHSAIWGITIEVSAPALSECIKKFHERVQQHPELKNLRFLFDIPKSEVQLT